MSVQSTMPSRISQPDSTDAGAKSKDGVRCHDTSCTCGRGFSARRRAAPLGQKVTTDLFLKQKQDQAKYHLYMFMTRLLRLYGSNVK